MRFRPAVSGRALDQLRNMTNRAGAVAAALRASANRSARRGRTAAAARMPHPAQIADDHDDGNLHHSPHPYIYIYMLGAAPADNFRLLSSTLYLHTVMHTVSAIFYMFLEQRRTGGQLPTVLLSLLF